MALSLLHKTSIWSFQLKWRSMQRLDETFSAALVTRGKYMTDDILSPTSDFALNIDDPDGLLEMPTTDIDPKELFPEREVTPGKTRKLDDNGILEKKEVTKITKTDKKIKKTKTKKECKTRTKREANKENRPKKRKNESDDCSCIICGAFYIDDKSGQGWIQCIVCHEWAEIHCIKTDPAFFTCPECSPDGDFEP